jgi:hypothetical protein
MLAADPAITEGIMTGIVRRWHAVFNEADDLRAALARAHVNKRAVEALFAAVDRRDREGIRAAYDENITIHEAASLPYGGAIAGTKARCATARDFGWPGSPSSRTRRAVLIL